MTEFRKVFDPQFVDFFRMFTLVDSVGDSLFELTPTAYNRDKGVDPRAKRVDPMNDTQSPERKARVEQLAAQYAVGEAMEISPFDY